MNSSLFQSTCPLYVCYPNYIPKEKEQEWKDCQWKKPQAAATLIKQYWEYYTCANFWSGQRSQHYACHSELCAWFWKRSFVNIPPRSPLFSFSHSLTLFCPSRSFSISFLLPYRLQLWIRSETNNLDTHWTEWDALPGQRRTRPKSLVLDKRLGNSEEICAS